MTVCKPPPPPPPAPHKGMGVGEHVFVCVFSIWRRLDRGRGGRLSHLLKGNCRIYAARLRQPIIVSAHRVGVPPNAALLNADGLYIGDKTRDDDLINLSLRQLIPQFGRQSGKCSSNSNPICFVQQASLCQIQNKMW